MGPFKKIWAVGNSTSFSRKVEAGPVLADLVGDLGLFPSSSHYKAEIHEVHKSGKGKA
jgi:hypothetical protein